MCPSLLSPLLLRLCRTLFASYEQDFQFEYERIAKFKTSKTLTKIAIYINNLQNTNTHKYTSERFLGKTKDGPLLEGRKQISF